MVGPIPQIPRQRCREGRSGTVHRPGGVPRLHRRCRGGTPQWTPALSQPCGERRPGPSRTASAIPRDMTIKRLDHVSVVVDDLAAAIAFFTALGMTLEAR